MIRLKRSLNNTETKQQKYKHRRIQSQPLNHW